MKHSIRFILIYIIIIFFTFGFYNTLISDYRENLQKIDKERDGVVYIKHLYLFTNNIIEYKSRIDTQEKQESLLELNLFLIQEIEFLQNIRSKKFHLGKDSFIEGYSKEKLSTLEDKYFYKILDWVNEESYIVGDKSGLLFQSDRKMFYLNSLITHYLPEYIISLSVVRNILYYQSQIGIISDKTKEIYIEQMKLVLLSSSEVSTLVSFLEPYENMAIFKKLITKIRKQLGKLPAQESDIEASLETLTTALLYSHRLNKSTINRLESIYDLKEKNVNTQITNYRSITLIISILFTMFFLYMKSLFNSNRKKEQSIIQLNETLDKLVVFAKTDADGYITHVSNAFLNLSGFREEAFIGRLHPSFKEKQNLETTEWSTELKERAKDGSYYWLKIRVLPEFNAHKKLIAYMMHGVNITYQKEIEAEKKRTQEALEFKSKFLSNMSHEIRTPLNAIIGFSTVALKTKLDEGQKNLMSKIKATSDLLLGIINDILDISKIESGKMHIEEQELNIQELVEDVKNILYEKAQEKGIDFIVEFSNIEHLYYYGDTLRVSQILVNLLNNAIKFTDEGYVKLLVSLKDKKLYFEVIDTGIGLKEESLVSLFEEFIQADMSTSRKYGGTGLGLSISKNLVNLMGGEIGVKSEFTKGSCFYFTLGLREAEHTQEQDSLEDETFASIEERVNQLQGIKVLVAEDNKTNQMVLDMLLEDTAFELDFADDGEIAVEKFKERKHSIIFMDLQMPNLDGYGATKAIREIDKEIVIIAISANVLAEDIEKAYSAGVNNYLSKPIDLEKMYRMLLSYI